jgi:hypothetical protein
MKSRLLGELLPDAVYVYPKWGCAKILKVGQ